MRLMIVFAVACGAADVARPVPTGVEDTTGTPCFCGGGKPAMCVAAR